GRGRGGRDRRSRPGLAGAPARRGRAARGGDGRRAAGVPRERLREMAAAGALRVRRRDPEDGGRKVQEDGSARALRDSRSHLTAGWAPASTSIARIRTSPLTKSGPACFETCWASVSTYWR